MYVVKSQSSMLKLSLKTVKPESCDEKQMLERFLLGSHFLSSIFFI